MGMYDEVVIGCPKCGDMFTVQTRMGKGAFHVYSLEELTPAIADDLCSEEVYCPWCKVRVQFVKKPTVKLVPYCE